MDRKTGAPPNTDCKREPNIETIISFSFECNTMNTEAALVFTDDV